jgi:AraC family transcriptional regulator
VGETLAEYIQRARLERSANLLLSRPENSIIDTAATCGFASAAAFSRAFRAHFGVSPSQFRTRKKSDLSKWNRNSSKDLFGETDYNLSQRNEKISGKGHFPVNVEVKKLPDMHVAYIRHIQGYRKGIFDSRIRQAFERVGKWVHARGLAGPDTLLIGIPYDNPEITPVDRRRYDACVTIPKAIVTSQGAIGIQDIPGGKYAICRIEAGVSDVGKIAEMVDGLYGEWLPGSGCRADDKPPLEIYREPVGKPAGTWICLDYCIPIRPL